MNKFTFAFLVVLFIGMLPITGSATTVTPAITYQGKLMDASGTPLNGSYTVRFNLYDVPSGGAALSTDTHSVTATNGLFTTTITVTDPAILDGRALWLGVRVGTDAEMTPRQSLQPVPYAFGLRPGVVGASFTTGQAGTMGNQLTGVNVSTRYDYNHGIMITTAGEDSYGITIETNDPYSYGVYARTNGLDSDGVYASTIGPGSNGMNAVTYGPNSHGVYAETSGLTSCGVYAFSNQSHGIYTATDRDDNRYGLYTPDYIWARGTQYPAADVAEFMPVTDAVSPGTVLVIGDDGRLTPATSAYDTRVAGIVSTDPGVFLGTKEDGNDGEALIAVAGRVPCKVDATYGAIRPGDILTTSSTPGYAMKAQPVMIAGLEIYKPSTVLGKALGTLESGTGAIEVIVTLQ